MTIQRSLSSLALVACILVSGFTAAQAELITSANSRTLQYRLNAKWAETHAGNNQYGEKFDNTGVDPNYKLDCNVSHDSNTNINTMSNCRMVRR